MGLVPAPGFIWGFVDGIPQTSTMFNYYFNEIPWWLKSVMHRFIMFLCNVGVYMQYDEYHRFTPWKWFIISDHRFIHTISISWYLSKKALNWNHRKHQVGKIIFKYQPLCGRVSLFGRVEACRHPNAVIYFYTVKIWRAIWYKIRVKYQPPGMAN